MWHTATRSPFGRALPFQKTASALAPLFFGSSRGAGAILLNCLAKRLLCIMGPHVGEEEPEGAGRSHVFAAPPRSSFLAPAPPRAPPEELFFGHRLAWLHLEPEPEPLEESCQRGSR